MYKKLLQNYKLSYWRSYSAEYIGLLKGNNSVEVKVGSDFIRVWVNGVMFREKVRVDPDRLIKYDHLSLPQPLPSCASVDFQTSFVEFPGK